MRTCAIIYQLHLEIETATYFDDITVLVPSVTSQDATPTYSADRISR